MNELEIDASLAEAAWLQREFRRIIPPSCAVEVCRYVDALDVVLNGEQCTSATARIEVVAGRTASRRALSRFGFNRAGGWLDLSNRRSSWPHGYVGTICHSHGIAIAIVGPESAVGAIGIDVQHSNGLTPELWPQVLTTTELGFIRAAAPDERDRWATVVLCAKEAFHKMLLSITGTWLECADAEVTVASGSDSFAVASVQPRFMGLSPRSIYHGRFARGPFATLAYVKAV
jgi:4'-phosphopantetheinyl transferase EntD